MKKFRVGREIGVQVSKKEEKNALHSTIDFRVRTGRKRTVFGKMGGGDKREGKGKEKDQERGAS